MNAYIVTKRNLYKQFGINFACLCSHSLAEDIVPVRFESADFKGRQVNGRAVQIKMKRRRAWFAEGIASNEADVRATRKLECRLEVKHKRLRLV